MNHKGKIAFVGGGGMNGYSVSLALKAAGYRVCIIDCRRKTGCYSLYSEFIYGPDPAVSEKDLINFLLLTAQEFGKERILLFPTNDEWVDAVSSHRNYLSEHFWFLLPETKVVNLLLDKLKFGQWARGRWHAPTVYAEVGDIDSYPVVAKPIKRRKAGKFEGETSQIKADSFRFVYCPNSVVAREVQAKAERSSVNLLFQEYLPGDSRSLRTVGVSAYQGELLGYIYGAKLRGFPIQYGDTIVGEIQVGPDHLIESVKEILAELRYTGIAELEFIFDSVTDKYHLLEINPRSWSWFGVAKPSGVCLVSLLLKATSGLRYEEVQTASRVPFRYLKLFENCANFICSNESRSGHLREILQDIKMVLVGRGVISGFERFDPLVNILTVLSPLKSIPRRLVKR